MDLVKNETSSAKNPFFHRAPIRDRRYFFGRTKETRQALQMLGENQCISVVGPRRMGKTSFLFHLCDPEVRKEYGIGDEHLFVYVDCQGLEDLNRLQFYQWLWKEAKKALKERGESEGWAQSISNFNDLRDAMEMVQSREHRLTFLFDEFELLATSENMDLVLFSSLRNLSEGFQVTYATASQMPVQELTYYDNSALNSPFFNNFRTVPLRLLEPGEAKEMVLGLTKMVGRENYFSGEDLDFAFEVAGYHPFFLQVACWYLFERKTERGELTTEDYQTVRRRYIEDVERYFHYIWDHSEADEQESMRLVCKGKASLLSAEQRRRLERKCVLQGDTLFSSAFAEFVQRQNTAVRLGKTAGAALLKRLAIQSITALRISVLLAVCGLVIGWFSIQVSSPVAMFFAGGFLLIALLLLVISWLVRIMSQHPTEKASNFNRPALTAPKTEPDALLHVRPVTPDKGPVPFSLWLCWSIAAAIALGLPLLILWRTYIYPRTYPPLVNVPPLSISLVQPTYIAFGDEAYLDVTVTNNGTVPVTGTIAVVFEGSAVVCPMPAQKTAISLDDLAGGASLTQRVIFSLCQVPTWFCQDMVRLSLRVPVGDQRMRFPIESQITVAPIPHIRRIISYFSGSTITAAAVAFLWDEVKKRLIA